MLCFVVTHLDLKSDPFLLNSDSLWVKVNWAGKFILHSMHTILVESCHYFIINFIRIISSMDNMSVLSNILCVSIQKMHTF